MKILTFILSVLLTTALLFGAVVLTVLASPDSTGGAFLLGILGATFLVYGPLTIGSVTAYWDPAVSDRSRHYLRRWLLVTIGVEVLSAIAVVVFVYLTSAAAWIAGVMIGGSAVLTVLALVVGPIIRRHDARHRSPEPAWTPISRREIQRATVTIAATFGIVLVVGLAAILTIDGANHGRVGIVRDILFAVDFACIAGALAAIIVAIPLNRRLRGITAGDVARMRDVVKVVLRGKRLELDAADQVSAMKYAAVASVTIPLQLTYLVLLYIGLGMNQTVLLTGKNPAAFTVGYLIFIVLFLAFFVPLSVVRLRRARRYIAEKGQALGVEQLGDLAS
jgi:MFS family permease